MLKNQGSLFLWKIHAIFFKNKISLRCIILFVLVIGFKLLEVHYFSTDSTKQDTSRLLGKIAVKAGDTQSYIEPIENLLNKHEYYYLDVESKEKIYMGRLPHYGLHYGLFRLFLNRNLAMDFLVYFQVLLHVLSCFALANIVSEITQHTWTYYITLLGYVFSTYVSYWNQFILTESLSISYLIFFLFFYLKYFQNNKLIHLGLGVFFLTFASALKPYFLALFLFVFIHLLYFKKKNINILYTFLMILGIVSMFFLPYGIRNYLHVGTFNPLPDLYAGNYKNDNVEFPMRGFIQSWGGSIVYWDKKSAASYFKPLPNIKSEFVFPDYALCSTYTKSDMQYIQNLAVKYYQGEVQLGDTLSYLYNEYSKQYKNEKPWMYYVGSRILLLKHFLFHSGSYYISQKNHTNTFWLFTVVLKISQSFLYYVVLIFGIYGLVKNVKYHVILSGMISIVGLLVVLFPLVLKATEWRFFVPAYPFLLTGAILFFKNSVKK